MSEIAEKADISIGSLYQYFRDKPAIIGELGLRYHAQSSACIEAELCGVRDPLGLHQAFTQLMAIYFDLFKTSPAMRDVWMAIQSDKSLQAIEADANTRNGTLLADALRRASPKLDSELARLTGVTIMALGPGRSYNSLPDIFRRIARFTAASAATGLALTPRNCW